MSNKPLVSVVIIFLNAEKFIREAIESVFLQTYGNWELLLVDDGSTDDSLHIALRLAEQYPENVHYLEHVDHQNCGMSASRNLGIKRSKGEYIAFLDADDVWLPHKLEQQVAVLDAHPEAAMVYGASQYWHSWTGKTEDIGRDFVPELRIQPNTVVKPPTLLVLALEGKAPTPPPSDILLRRDVVEDIGGFNVSWRGIYQIYEDQVFFAKLYLQAPVFVAGECWDRYRLHPDSCCAVVERAGKHDVVRLAYLHWLEAYLSEKGMKGAAVWEALQHALRPYRHPTLAVEITAVTRPPLNTDLLWGGYIDQPTPGDQFNSSEVPICGWVLGRQARAVAVEIVCQGTMIQHAPTQVHRPDLVVGYPHVPEAEYGGFRTTVNVDGMPELDLLVQAVLENQRRVPLGTVRAQQRRQEEVVDSATLVSVVIPCYNQARFLGEAIESVLTQTYRHFEIVVVDDGSSDNAAAVAARYPNVRFIRDRNQGPPVTYNTGLYESKGSYVVFLDGDDRLLPNALEVGLNCLNAHPECAFVVGQCRYIGFDGTTVVTPPQSVVTKDHYLELLHSNYIWMNAMVMYRRGTLKAVEGFNTSLKACEDYDLYLRIARQFPIYCHNQVVAEYRQHDTNMSRDPKLMLTSYSAVLHSQWTYVKGNQQYEAAYRQGAKRAEEYYGEQLVNQMRAQIGVRKWKQVLDSMRVLRRHYPQGLASIIGVDPLLSVERNLLQQRAGELTDETDIAHHEATELNQTIAAQTALLEVLTAQVDRMSSYADELQVLLQDAQNQLWYQHLIQRIRQIVSDVLPVDATVIVVSKGDNALLKLNGRRAWHFPQTEDGMHAADYPANSAEAIAHLEQLRAKGGDFLLVPSTACWRLEHYAEFKQHLESQYSVVVRQEDTCLIFALCASGTEQADPGEGFRNAWEIGKVMS